MSELLDKLSGVLGARGLVTAAADMEPYCTDWRGRKHGHARAVALPSSTEEVSAVMAICRETGTPVFPQGGNTSVCYGAIPSESGRGIVLGLRRLNKIRSVDRSDNALVAEAGVALTSVHQAAADVGRQFPLHLGSEGSAQVGGLISTNAGGTAVLRYGNMRDLVLGLEVVLADGRIWNGLSTLRKDNTGYDLKHLFIGGEGTLGVVTAAALKLFPLTPTRAHGWIAVPSPAHALDLLGRFQDAFDTSIHAFELLSGSEIDITLEHVPGNRIPFAATPRWSILIELASPDRSAALAARFEAVLAEALEAGEIVDAVVAQSEAQAQSFWRLRHSVSEANKLHGISHTHDISIPVAQVPRFIAQADAMLAREYPAAVPVVVAHLGDGNVHYIAMFSREDWSAYADADARIEDLQARVHDIAAGLGGSFSAEHGIGRKLVGEFARLTPGVELDLQRSLKRLLDPDNRMNPGIVFESRRS